MSVRWGGRGPGHLSRWPKAVSSSGPTPATLVHVPIYGQSLALGSDPDGGSVITASAVSGHYMLNGGVRCHYDTPSIANVNSYLDPAQAASLSTLEEQVNPNDANMAETFAAGMALRMTEKGVFTSTARGAYAIADLTPSNTIVTGWLHFSNTYAAVERARDLCDAAGHTYSVGPVIFKQGEADGGANTSKADYKTRLLALQQRMQDALVVANKASVGTLPFICDQQAMGFAGATYGEIAVAVIELHRSNPTRIVCAGPTYNLEFTAINDVHMISNTYRNYGEKLGQVWQAVRDGGWNPCHITGVSRSTTTITVTIHVPTAPLVVDTTLVSSIADSGFTYSGANITDVSITDTGTNNVATIEITIDADAGGTLGYAYQNNETDQRIGPTVGPRGNIRDSDPFETLNDSTAMPNWLCVDQWVVA